MFENTSDEELVRIDESARRYWAVYESASPDLLLDVLHPSGFKREAAIQRLSKRRDGSELRYLLLRVNDWVPQVRDRAIAAVEARLTPEYAPHFAKHLGLVARLWRSRRVDHSDLLHAILQLMSSDTLLRAMTEHRGDTRRVIFRILVDRNAADSELFRTMARFGDPAIRLAAMRTLPVEGNRDVFESLFDDPVGAVRAYALMMAADRERLQAALFDRNANVREMARYRLRDDGIDFAALYRTAVPSLVAIAGLAETGTRADVTIVAPFLEDPRATVRRAAIRTVLTLGGDDYVDRVLPLLSDESRGVSSQARRSLMPHGPVLDAATLWTLYESTTADYVRRNVLTLMTALPRWESITFFVRALAHEHIARWNEFFNRRPSAPTTRQLQALDEALAQSSLPEETIQMIRFSMRASR